MKIFLLHSIPLPQKRIKKLYKIKGIGENVYSLYT